MPDGEALLAAHRWDAVIVDGAFGRAAAEGICRLIKPQVACRLVLATPTDRADLPALKAAGFTGYLIKPIRTASLAARFGAAAAPVPIVDPVSQPSVAASARSLVILVAEDNEINALLARALLVKLGHQPTMTASGDAAVDSWLAARAAGTPYDRVLMDLHMPGMDGLEATRRIREIEAEGGAARTPILALTANASADDRQACLEAGMDGFLVKPLDRERLAVALATAGKAALAA
jgi:CheY-like chemotaxis protein